MEKRMRNQCALKVCRKLWRDTLLCIYCTKTFCCSSKYHENFTPVRWILFNTLCVEYTIGLVYLASRVLNIIQHPRRSATPPLAAWKLRLMLESVVNFSVWFACNVVCGGSGKILMGWRGHGVFNTFLICSVECICSESLEHAAHAIHMEIPLYIN